jgi:hypothetical protein
MSPQDYRLVVGNAPRRISCKTLSKRLNAAEDRLGNIYMAVQEHLSKDPTNTNMSCISELLNMALESISTAIELAELGKNS